MEHMLEVNNGSELARERSLL